MRLACTLSTPTRLVLAGSLMDAVFFMPVAAMTFALRGVNMADFLLIQGLFRVAMLVLEVPTGFLADRWSRARQLQVAHGLWLLYIGLLTLASSFGAVLMAELVCALAISLASGTVQAYLHEALRHEGRETEQGRWQSRLFALSLAAESVAGLCGGWFFSFNANLPMLLTLLGAVAALGVALTFKNVPRQEGPRRHANAAKDVLIIMHHSLRVHPRLPAILLGPNVMFGLTGVLFWGIQLRLEALGSTPVMIGIAMASYFAIKAVLAWFADHIHGRMAQRFFPVLVGLLTLGTVLMMLPSALLVWLGGVLGGGVVHALGSPVNINLINREVPDHERATVISVASMVSRSLGAIFLVGAAPLLHWLSLSMLMGLYLAVTLTLMGLPRWQAHRAQRRALAKA